MKLVIFAHLLLMRGQMKKITTNHVIYAVGELPPVYNVTVSLAWFLDIQNARGALGTFTDGKKQ